MAKPPIDFNGIDTTVHGPVRLGVLTSLQMEGQQDFTTLRDRLSVAPGALGNHLQKLESMGYVTCRKEFVERRPRTTYRISKQGEKALMNYLSFMQELIDSIRG